MRTVIQKSGMCLQQHYAHFDFTCIYRTLEYSAQMLDIVPSAGEF